MIVLIIALAVLLGAVVGAVLARHYITSYTPSARQRRNHLDAIALLRDLRDNPDGLSLRPRAQEIIEAFETSPRKDT